MRCKKRTDARAIERTRRGRQRNGGIKCGERRTNDSPPKEMLQRHFGRGAPIDTWPCHAEKRQSDNLDQLLAGGKGGAYARKKRF
jgi:hypothetical protein